MSSIKKSLAAQVRSQVRLDQPMKEIADNLVESAKGESTVSGRTLNVDLDGDGDNDLFINDVENPSTIAIRDDRYRDSVSIQGNANSGVDSITASTETNWGDFRGHISTRTWADSQGETQQLAQLHGVAGQHRESVSFSGGVDKHNEIVDRVDLQGARLDGLAESVVNSEAHHDRIKDDPAYQAYGDAVPDAKASVQASQSAFSAFLNHLKE